MKFGMFMDCASRMTSKIQIDQLTDAISRFNPTIERVELSWDSETIRYSDKSQKAIDTLRVRCLKLKSLVLRLL